jgi:hypothetical protein
VDLQYSVDGNFKFISESMQSAKSHDSKFKLFGNFTFDLFPLIIMPKYRVFCYTYAAVIGFTKMHSKFSSRSQHFVAILAGHLDTQILLEMSVITNLTTLLS